jgi:predicted RNase H-like HicB family nuclease
MPKKIRELRTRMRHEYSMLIQWSDEDQVFVVTLTEFGPSNLTHGTTYEDAAKNGREVLDLRVETYEEKGWTLPPPAKFESSES